MSSKTTQMSPEFWRAKVAQAIGKPELAGSSDEDLLTAHAAHMKLMEEMDDLIDQDGNLRDQSEQAHTDRSSKITPVKQSIPPEMRDGLDNTAGAGERILALVNAERSADPSLSWDKAWDRIRWRRPELFRKHVAQTPIKGVSNELRAPKHERSAKILELVNNHTAHGTTYDDAWALVRAENPGLFVGMIEPKSKR
jgi:hypothetical protein